LDKVVAVSGDVTTDNFGLNSQDESELVENVQIIFHCAAVIKFNEKLKDTVNCNTTGIWRISHSFSPELY